MKKTIIAIAFAVASVPMFAAQAPANPPANGTKTETAKPKKHVKKASKKTSPKKESTGSPVSK